jgi:hypothetical protein
LSTRKAVEASIRTVRSLSGSTHDAASIDAASGRPGICCQTAMIR